MKISHVKELHLGKKETQIIVLVNTMSWLTLLGKNPHPFIPSASLTFHRSVCSYLLLQNQHWTKLFLPQWGGMKLDSVGWYCLCVWKIEKTSLLLQNIFLYSWEVHWISTSGSSNSMRNKEWFYHSTSDVLFLQGFHRTSSICCLVASLVLESSHLREVSSCPWSCHTLKILLSRVSGNSLLHIKAIWPEGTG